MHKKCPCHSGLFYSLCCEKFHKGKLAPTATQLMRSRYSAYALHLADYIMSTTHPKNPQYIKDKKSWKVAIDHFCRTTQFIGLTIHEYHEKPNANDATITFTADLVQANQDVRFTEKSYFEKTDGQWYYKHGEVQPYGKANT